MYITCSFLIPSGGGGRLGGGCFSRLIFTGLTGHSSSEGVLSGRTLSGVGGRGLSGYSDVSINKNLPKTKSWYNMLHISFIITHVVPKAITSITFRPYFLTYFIVLPVAKAIEVLWVLEIHKKGFKMNTLNLDKLFNRLQSFWD